MYRTLALGAAVTTNFHNFGVSAALTWIRAGTTETCAGIEDPCNSLETCTRVGVGPCTDPATGPAFYITSEFVGLGFVGNAATYLTDPTQAKIVEPYNHPNNGYRDFNGSVSGSGYSYAYVMTGAHFGANPNQAGGYVGVASFVMKTGTVQTSTNAFHYAASPGAARLDHSANGGSAYGAPDGPQEVCIAAKKNGACGDPVQYSAGDYKFTIYGYTTGEQYAAGMQAGSNGFPNPTNYMGVRTKLKAHGLTNLTASFNNNVALENLGSTDVTSMTLGSAQGRVRYVFPTEYNVGTNTSVPTATKNVKIKVSAVPGDNKALFVDYLFDNSDFTSKDVYFVYDPTTTADSQSAPVPVTTTTAEAGANTTTTTSIGSTSAAVMHANFVAAVLLGISNFLMC